MSTQQFTDFAHAHNLFLDVLYVGQRDSTPTDKTKWAHFLWSCTLRTALASPHSVPSKAYTFEYRTGLGHVVPVARVTSRDPLCKPAKPTIGDVLYSLQMDCQSGECPTFEDFASEFGYDEDSREAERIYTACKHVRRTMRALLGAEAFTAFLSLEEI